MVGIIASAIDRIKMNLLANRSFVISLLTFSVGNGDKTVSNSISLSAVFRMDWYKYCKYPELSQSGPPPPRDVFFSCRGDVWDPGGRVPRDVT